MIIFIIIILISYLIAIISSISTPSKKKYVNSIIIFVLGLIILTIFFFNRQSELKNTDTDSYIATADGFTIEGYDIVLDVDQTNKIEVTEIVTVNWYENYHHGIYKFTPEWLKYTGKDGKSVSRKAEISNLQAVGEPYSIDVVNKKKRIKIGSASSYLPLGNHTYTIKYTYDMDNDPFKDFDEFIFHAYGDYWGTRINNATITINMPSSFSNDKIKFFSDKYRQNDITNYVNYEVIGNSIKASLSNNYDLTKSLTVDIELPDGYFINSESNYGHISLVLCLIILLFTIISFINWLNYGKDYDKISQPVEFYPPENMDASEIGYIYGKENSKKLTISLIVQLASKGYIKIQEQEDKSRIITKEKDSHRKLEITMEDVYEAIDRCINVKLSDNYNPEQVTNEEKALIEDMFKNSKEFKVRRNYDMFYKDYNDLIKKNYIIVESDNIKDYTETALNNIKKQLEEKYQIGKKFIHLTANEQRVYDDLFVLDDQTNLKENKTFYQAFDKVGNNLDDEYDEKIKDIKSYKKMMFTSILFLVSVILWILSYRVFEDMNPKLNFIYTISFISLFVIVFFMFIMTRKTTYGEEITAKVKGFRNYIETAEKNRINELVNENPNYFYDILPYAYALGVSKKWIEKFEDIPIPENNMGNFDYCDMSSFNDLSDSVYRPPSSSGSSSGGGGCSSCGGGCSSCGGGCSSCGGGGSW